jgi:hypothetical protein
MRVLPELAWISRQVPHQRLTGLRLISRIHDVQNDKISFSSPVAGIDARLRPFPSGKTLSIKDSVSGSVKFVQNGRFEIHIDEAIALWRRAWFCDTPDFEKVSDQKPATTRETRERSEEKPGCR